jgi:hypothetical protein
MSCGEPIDCNRCEYRNHSVKNNYEPAELELSNLRSKISGLACQLTPAKVSGLEPKQVLILIHDLLQLTASSPFELAEIEKDEKAWPGERAKELGEVLGEIGCPHCGASVVGAISPICSICEKPYWDKNE